MFYAAARYEEIGRTVAVQLDPQRSDLVGFGMCGPRLQVRIGRGWVLESRYGDRGSGGMDFIWVKRF